MSEPPEVAKSGDDLHRQVIELQIVGVQRLIVEHEVDLGGAEASRLDLELVGDQKLDLALEQGGIPCREQRELVVGDDVGALVARSSRWPRGPGRRSLEPRRRFDPAMTAQDDVVVIDQHRRGEAELPHAGGDLGELLLGMTASVGRPGFEVSGRPFLDVR